MPHVFCKEEKCRRVMHLDGEDHWDYEGYITCKRCGARMKVDILNGQVQSTYLVEKGDL